MIRKSVGSTSFQMIFWDPHTRWFQLAKFIHSNSNSRMRLKQKVNNYNGQSKTMEIKSMQWIKALQSTCVPASWHTLCNTAPILEARIGNSPFRLHIRRSQEFMKNKSIRNASSLHWRWRGTGRGRAQWHPDTQVFQVFNLVCCVFRMWYI